MRDYAKISPLFWTRGSGKKLRGKPNAQVVAFYLVTCPTSNMIGIYYQPLVTIAHETGLSIEDTRIALGECSLADFAHYDEDAEMVWVPNMASYQIGDELKPGDKRRGAVLAELGRVDGHRFADEFRITYGNGYGIEGASKGHRRPLEGVADEQEAPSKGKRDPREEQEQEQEQDQEQDQDIAGSASPPGLVLVPVEAKVTRSDLESAYDAYPLKEGKQKGLDKLAKQVKTGGDLEQLKRAIGNYAAQRKVDGKYCLHFSTFASEWRDWIDWQVTTPPPTNGAAKTGHAPAAPHNTESRIRDDF